MFLLLNDIHVIMAMSETCVLVSDGYKLSKNVIMGDSSLTCVEVSNVPSNIIPYAFKYEDGQFKTNTERNDNGAGLNKYKAETAAFAEELDIVKEVVIGKDPSEMTVEEYKVSRREENNNILKEYLKWNPMPWLDGKSYGATLDDQTEIMGTLTGYQLEQAAGINNPIEWHASGEGCVEWTLEALSALSISIKAYAKKFVKLNQHYKVLILSCTTKEEIAALEFIYNEEVANVVDNLS